MHTLFALFIASLASLGSPAEELDADDIARVLDAALTQQPPPKRLPLELSDWVNEPASGDRLDARIAIVAAGERGLVAMRPRLRAVAEAPELDWLRLPAMHALWQLDEHARWFERHAENEQHPERARAAAHVLSYDATPERLAHLEALDLPREVIDRARAAVALRADVEALRSPRAQLELLCAAAGSGMCVFTVLSCGDRGRTAKVTVGTVHLDEYEKLAPATVWARERLRALSRTEPELAVLAVESAGALQGLDELAPHERDAALRAYRAVLAHSLDDHARSLVRETP